MAPAVTMAAESELSLVVRAQDGDVDAFEKLVQRYHKRVFGLAYRMLSDHGDAEDVVQDTLVTAWRRLPTLAEPAAFRGWLYQVATRRCLSLLRARERRNTQPASEAVIQDRSEQLDSAVASTHASPSVIVKRRIRLDHLATLVVALSDDQRACWVLRELHQLSYEEVAAATDLSVSTVRGRIARARQNLARGLAAFDRASV